MNVHACLRVDATHEKVLVSFMVENRGERRVWLENAVAADTALTRALFELREEEGGAEVAYTGTVAKQHAPSAGDWFELPPHSAHTHTIDITRAYAFRTGTHAYRIRYAGRAVEDIRQPAATTPLATDPVVFRHTEPAA